MTAHSDGDDKPNAKRRRNSISTLQEVNNELDGFIWIERRLSPMKLDNTTGLLFKDNCKDVSEMSGCTT